MKAVVLAGGLGTRLRRPSAAASLDAAQAATADLGLKALVPVAGRPFLDYGLSRLADAGIVDVCIVVGPASAAVRDHYRTAPPGRVRLSFSEQSGPRGSADALLTAEAFVAGDEFLALNSDDLYPVSAIRRLRELEGPGLPVFSGATLTARGNFPAERLARFATLEVGADGTLRCIVEKPVAGPASGAAGDALYSMNLWRFPATIFEACRRVPLSSRGEYELPQAVSLGISELGLRLRTFPCEEGVLDLSTREDVSGLDRSLAAETPRP